MAEKPSGILQTELARRFEDAEPDTNPADLLTFEPDLIALLTPPEVSDYAEKIDMAKATDAALTSVPVVLEMLQSWKEVPETESVRVLPRQYLASAYSYRKNKRGSGTGYDVNSTYSAAGKSTSV